MSETDNAAKSLGEESAQIAPWLLATIEDVVDVDIEAPLENAKAADCGDLSDIYQAAAKPDNGSVEPAGSPTTRVYTMLSAVTGMHFKPHDRNEPFGARVAWADGRRSAILSDFESHVDVLADMAERASNPVLRARLCDVCWFLDRKRRRLGLAAIAAYATVVEKTDRGELTYGFATEDAALEHEACDYLRRALQIGRTLGWKEPETIAARELLKTLRVRSLVQPVSAPIHWFCDLDLDFVVSDPAEIGAGLDQVLAPAESDAGSPNRVELWRLAARAYHLAKKEEDTHRCLAEAAEQLVQEAQSKQGSAFLASHFLSAAIAQLHGVPGKKDRRTELRHQLVDIQARIPEEMSVISKELDLREIVEKIQNALRLPTLLEKLFVFADLARSPDPEKLASDAAAKTRKHPLSSLFETSHLDREGKTVARTGGGDFGVTPNDDAIRQQVAQDEAIRRQLVAHGYIDIARQSITEKHFVSENVLVALMQCSPFVPPYQANTFSRGFARFFQGDFVSATYILTPLLENSLRHILKCNGHDVTIFDDATQTQKDRTISSLFEQMRPELESALTPKITGDIDRVFLSKPGPHVRHAISHGLLHDGEPYGADAIYACWLVFRLCLLPLFPHFSELQARFVGSELYRT